MATCSGEPPSEQSPLLSLPDEALLHVLRFVDGRGLACLEQTCRGFSRRDSASHLPLLEHVARENVYLRCNGSDDIATRFRKESWKKRLYLEDSCGCGFERTWSESAGFTFFRGSTSHCQTPIVRLAGMGPKLLISDKSTVDQPVLRWRLRVRGNTAVEFGALPLGVELGHTALHKCVSMLVSVPDSCEEQQAVGFCSQITAGSFLPLKVPVMRGTILDVVLRKGHFSVVMQYPEDAKEISWQNGQPVPRPYYGPPQLRFEQDFSSSYDVRLAATAWAKASFEVLHDGHNLEAWEETDTTVTEEIENVTSRIMSQRITESEYVCTGPELRVTAIANGINHLPIPSHAGDPYPEQCTEEVQSISGMSTSVVGGCP